MFKNDLQQYREAQRGSVKAFEKLFKRYYAPLCCYIYRYTVHSGFSEEIVQELFYALWRDRAHVHIERSVRLYLYEAVRNRALRYLEHLRVHERGVEDTSSFCPEEEAEARDLESRLSEILLGFPDRRRRIYYMHRFGGDKYTEVAAKLSISVRTVEAEMHRALKALSCSLMV